MESNPAQHPEERLKGALQTIVDALPGASPTQRAFLLKRGGDVCVGLDERQKALGWYGRAIDQLLELGDAEQAALLCRLIVSVQPDAVRARCTLTWIALGTGRHDEAVEHLAAYVQAAFRAGRGALAARQLGWMFEAAGPLPLRERIVLELCNLGDSGRADELAARLRTAPAPLEPDRLWQRVLDAAVGRDPLPTLPIL